MHYNVIVIRFQTSKIKNLNDIFFDYNFIISKEKLINYYSIAYSELIEKFRKIGFNLKYLKFNDIDANDIVYCSYNHQLNIDNFFLSYEKCIKPVYYHLTFEYGNHLNGIFFKNNISSPASITFSNFIKNKKYIVDVIYNQQFQKISETYQITLDDGRILSDITNEYDDFKTNFFERYDVIASLRKLKLLKLKNI